MNSLSLSGKADRFAGVLLGTALGDAFGLPFEGLKGAQIRKRLPEGELRFSFCGCRGMWSDDTEHTWFVAQALLKEANDPNRFARILATKLRWWLLGLPAGIGFATLRSTIKLWLGFPPGKSGVRSAGNGPCMRAAIIGAYFSDDSAKRTAFVSASTRLTHTDPRAEIGAKAVAEIAAAQCEGLSDWGTLLNRLAELSPDAEWQGALQTIRKAANTDRNVQDFASLLGLEAGVTGYVFHTVPVAIYAWRSAGGDFAQTVLSVIRCGGDTDTVAAIAGGLVGAQTGTAALPIHRLNELLEWPRSPHCLIEAATRLAEQKEKGGSPGPVSIFWPGVLLRNVLFLILVLGHGVTRLFR